MAKKKSVKKRFNLAEYEDFKDYVVSVDAPDMSCGVQQLSGVDMITDIEHVHATIVQISEECIPAFLQFSSTADSKGAALLAKSLKDLDIGKLVKSSAIKNPGSGNLIVLWTLEVDYAAFTALVDKIENAVMEASKSYEL